MYYQAACNNILKPTHLCGGRLSLTLSRKLDLRLMKILFLLFAVLSSADTLAAEDVWTAFWDKENYKRGFKDVDGNIKITPKFMGMTQATEFKNIVAVMEENEGEFDAYYLLKNGDRVKEVKMFTFDNSFDCESDNKIRFRDKKTDAMGYLSAKGAIAIPPTYNFGQPFSNGLTSVIKGATLSCHNGKPFGPENRCEHAHWKGGEKLVIDAKNKILLKNVFLSHELDRHSLSISKDPIESEIIESFRGIDGNYLNFVNTEKHFEMWFRKNILGDIKRSNIEMHSFEEVAQFKSGRGWYKKPKRQFWRENHQEIIKALNLLNANDSSFFVSIDGINQFIFEEDKYKPYYSQCYNLIANRHPTLSVIADHEHAGSKVQNIFEFLRINDTYKIISITLRTGDLI